MYPVIRLAKEFFKYRKAPDLPIDGVHISHHMCLPWDIDLWRELNNGRTLTLYDLGRLVLARRVGLLGALKRKGWSMTMAGAVVRYRQRVRVFEVVEMRSRAIGWDGRFLYLEQSMWGKNGACANHCVYRAAVVDENGIVGTDRVLPALGYDGPDLPIPDWVQKWIAAEDARPWPPMQD